MTHEFNGVARNGYQDISPSDLEQLPAHVRFIDVREPAEFDGDLGHLERAELVPLGTLGEACQAWDRSAPLLLICRSGNRSGRAALALAQAGFENLANLAGGMSSVRGQGI